MPEAQITVRYVNQPQQGKKNGTIKTDDGQLYFVTPEMLSQFEQGGRYKITYKINDFRGVKYHYVETVNKLATAAPAAGANAHNAVTRGTYGTVDMATAERIFVCGALNAMLSNQNTLPFTLLADDLVARVNILRETWRQTLGNPQQDAEMNDEIPY